MTQSDNILVTECGNNALHLLNEKGEVIAIQNTQNNGRELPHSLCFDNEGFLLIGCNSSVKDKDDAKIHAVKLSVRNVHSKVLYSFVNLTLKEKF